MTVSWNDPQSAHNASRKLGGIEYLRELSAGRIALPPIMRRLGFRFAKVEEGLVVFECEPGEQHYNTIGVVHGGLAMTLLDSAMGCCVHTHRADRHDPRDRARDPFRRHDGNPGGAAGSCRG